MTQELIYTSAPRGVKPGSQGFCTVCCTQGMLPSLAERLESLSNYRHVVPPGHPQAALNPVVWSHLRLPIGGRTCHVLSRITAAGLDYTNRSNNLAHHVVLDPGELAPCGPAAVLAQDGFMETTWQGAPRTVPTGRRPAAAVPVMPAACRAWQALTGDGGWGGLLAQALSAPGSRPLTVVFRPGMELLPLVAESLALLSSERRWQVTFSTFFTGLPPGIDCQLRCVLDGSPEAAAARRAPQSMIDLCRLPALTASGPLVEAARTGRIPQFSGGPRAPATPVPGSNGPAGGDVEELVRLLTESDLSPARVGDGYAIASGGPPRPPSLPLGYDAELDDEEDARHRRGKRSQAPLWIAAGSAAALLILLSAGVAWYVSRSQSNAVAEVASPAAAKPTPPKVQEDADSGDPKNHKHVGRVAENPSKTTPSRPTEDRQPPAMEDAESKKKKHSEVDLTNIRVLMESKNWLDALQAIIAAEKDAGPKGNDALAMLKQNVVKAINEEMHAAIEQKELDRATELHAKTVRLSGPQPWLDAVKKSLDDAAALSQWFASMPGAVNLGAEKEGAASLLPCPIATELTLELIGGESVFPPPPKEPSRKSLFRLRKDSANSQWPCDLEVPSLGDKSIPKTVGRFLVADRTLKFEWTDTARASDSARRLQNCVLQLSCGGYSRKIALREHFLLGESDKRRMLANLIPIGRMEGRPQEFDVSDLPDNANLQVELLGTAPIHPSFTAIPDGGPELKVIPTSEFEFEPKEILIVARAQVPNKARGKVNIYFDLGIAANPWKKLLSDNLLLRTEETDFFPAMTKAFKRSDLSHPTPQEFERVIALFQKEAKKAGDSVDELTKKLKEANDGKKGDLQNQLDHKAAEKQTADKHKNEAESLRNLIGALVSPATKARLRFRVVLTIENERIVLIATDEGAVTERVNAHSAGSGSNRKL